MSEGNTLIQQTLHGYREGHRLLAASITLSPKAEQTMAALSDLSGHSRVRGFDEYLTGYPMVELGAYALAKTWYAPEMPRPGCVWTHTLLIPFATLGSARSLQTFVRLFNRPCVDDYKSFAEACLATVDEQLPILEERSGRSAKRAMEVLSRLYEAPDEAVLVPIEVPSEVEQLFFDIWSQQWPRLRRNFSFCTGAIAGRKLDGRWFDLQGVPYRRLEDVLRMMGSSVVAELSPRATALDLRKWCEVAVGDLERSSLELRNFLFEYGAEAGGGRRDFIPLTQLFLALNDELNDSVGSVLKALKSVFPDADVGTKLKSRLLAGEVGAESVRRPVSALRIVLHAKQDLIHTEVPQLAKLAQRAWADEPDAVIEMLNAASVDQGMTSGKVLSALADTLDPSRLASWSKAENAVMMLAAQRPIILAHRSFRSLRRRNSFLLDYLIHGCPQPDEVREILGGWMAEGEFECFDLAVRGMVDTPMPGVLDLVGSPSTNVGGEFPSDTLIRLCKQYPKRARKWLDDNIGCLRYGVVRPAVIGCVIVAMDYNSIRINRSNVEDWEFLLSVQQEIEPAIRNAAVMRLFLRAMNMRGINGARVATGAFPHVYRRLKNSQLSYEEWYILQDVAIGFGWDWDKCRRLIEGLVDRFREFDWPKKYFSMMLDKDAELALYMENTNFYRSRYKRFVARGRE